MFFFSWHCAVHFHSSPWLDLGLGQNTLLQLLIFPGLTCLYLDWAFRRVIFQASVKISVGCCKAMNSRDSSQEDTIPAGVGLFLCTASAWWCLRQRGKVPLQAQILLEWKAVAHRLVIANRRNRFPQTAAKWLEIVGFFSQSC